MDNQLLSLLQNASLSPQPPPAAHTGPGGASSPPPAGSSRSIDQLFASLAGSPPPQLQGALAPTHGGDHTGRQAQLLGLLKGASSTPGPDLGRSTPSPASGEQGRERATSPSQGRAQDLLASLFGKMPQSETAGGPGQPHSEPLLNHLSPTPPPPADLTTGAPMNGHAETETPGPENRSDVPPPPPPAQGAPAFTSSVFSFVSPFDAFEDIKPPTPKAPTPAPVPASVPAPPSAPAASAPPPPPAPQPTTDIPAKTKPASRHQSPAPSATSRVPSAPSPAPSSGAPDRFGSPRPEDMPPPKAEAAASGSKSAGTARAVSAAAPRKKKAVVEEYPMPYVARQHVVEGRASTTKRLSGRDVVFDLAAPNADSLAHSPNSAKERKISAVKTDTLATGLSARRGLAVSDTLLAYVLSKGGIRVLHQASAANALLSVEDDGKIIKAVNIDIVDGFVAAVLDDRSVAIWNVEDANGGELLPNSLLLRARPATSSADRVFWWRKAAGAPAALADLKLIVVTDGPILCVSADKAVEAQHLEGSELMSTGDGFIGADLLGDVVAAVHVPGTLAVLDVTGETPSWKVDLQSQVKEAGAASVTGVTALSSRDALVELDNGRAFLRVGSDGKVLVSIKLEAPPISGLPASIRPAAARWDAENRIVWIASLLRASLLGFATSHYAAGIDPTFTRAVEIPLEPLGDAVIKPSGGDGRGDVEIFYKFPKGFSQVSLQRKLVDELVADRASEGNVVEQQEQAPAPMAQEEPQAQSALAKSVAQEQPTEAKVAPREARTASKTVEPSAVVTLVAAPPAPTPRKAAAEAPKAGEASSSTPKAAGASLEEVTVVIKKSEDRLTDKINKSVQKEITKLRDQQNQRLETVSKSVSAAADAQAKQFAGFETTLQKAVQASFDDSALPNLEVILNKAISDAVTSQVPRAIEHTVKHAVNHEFERNVIPHLGHTLTSGLSPAIENHMRQMVQTVVLPQLSVAVQSMASSLGEAVHREMLEVRKSISQEQSLEMRQTHQSMQNMSTTLSSLIEQVKMLTAEVQTLRAQRPATAPEPAPSTGRLVSPPGATNGSISVVAPAPAADVPEDGIEDHFLAAFAELNDQQLLGFVMGKYPRIMTFLPNLETPAPLSQAVLLTIVHRLTKILRGNETGSREFQCALSWVFRAAQLIDRHSPSIASYVQPVFAASRAHLLDTSRVSNLAPDARAPHAEAARGIMAQVIGLLTL